MMESSGYRPHQEILFLQARVLPSPGTGPSGSLEGMEPIGWPIHRMELTGLGPHQEMLYLLLFVLQSPGTGLYGSQEGVGPIDSPIHSMAFNGLVLVQETVYSISGLMAIRDVTLSPGTGPYGWQEGMVPQIDLPIPTMESFGLAPVLGIVYLPVIVLPSPGTAPSGLLEDKVRIG